MLRSEASRTLTVTWKLRRVVAPCGSITPSVTVAGPATASSGVNVSVRMAPSPDNTSPSAGNTDASAVDTVTLKLPAGDSRSETLNASVSGMSWSVDWLSIAETAGATLAGCCMPPPELLPHPAIARAARPVATIAVEVFISASRPPQRRRQVRERGVEVGRRQRRAVGERHLSEWSVRRRAQFEID